MPLNAATIEPLIREIFIKAPREKVYRYFTEAEKMQSWKGRKARLDPRPGGEYWVDINGEDRASGQFVELQPYERLVFTWGWEGENSSLLPGASTVEILFIAQAEGTLVKLKHFDLDEAQQSYNGQGWDRFLPILAKVAEEAESTD